MDAQLTTTIDSSLFEDYQRELESLETFRELVVRPFDLDRPRIKLARLGDEGYELVIPIRSATRRSEAVEAIELSLDPHGDLLAALRLHHALARHVESARYVFPGTPQA